MIWVFSKARVNEAKVDWITCTASTDPEKEQLMLLGEQVISQREQDGFFAKPAGFQGYRGYGVDCGFVGTRTDGVCLRVSGDTAHRLSSRIAEVGPHITRLDIQATVLLDTDDMLLARRMVDNARNESRSTNSNRQRRAKLVDDGDSGSTAYFGVRTAPRYGRIYDKARETNGDYPAGSWRVEAESKRRLAEPLFYRLAEWDFRQEAIIAMLVDYFHGFGVHLDIPKKVDVPVPIVPRVTSDAERRIKWLRDTVSPVVRRLHEEGYAAEAAEALYGWLMPFDERGTEV